MGVSASPDASAPAAGRYERLDALRGVAIVWMAAFHFCFDLNHYGLIEQDFYADPWWTVQRSAIVTLFLLCVGMGQAVAQVQGQSLRRFGRRWAQIAGCAVLVSLGSALMFPRTYISFGVLHGIAVMLLLLRLAAPAGRWPWLLWWGGAVALLLPLYVEHPFFDARATNWVGLVTHKPITEDYVPVLPWRGEALWGLAAGQWVLRHRAGWLSRPLPVALRLPGRPLAALGRWSLSFYMLHQPVLIGGVLAAIWLFQLPGATP